MDPQEEPKIKVGGGRSHTNVERIAYFGYLGPEVSAKFRRELQRGFGDDVAHLIHYGLRRPCSVSLQRNAAIYRFPSPTSPADELVTRSCCDALRGHSTPRPRPHRRHRHRLRPRPTPPPARRRLRPQHRPRQPEEHRDGQRQQRRTATLRHPRPLTLLSTTAVTPCRRPARAHLAGLLHCCRICRTRHQLGRDQLSISRRESVAAIRRTGIA